MHKFLCLMEKISSRQGKTRSSPKLTSHNLGMVRARAIDESSGQAWDMIIAATGEVLDLTEQQEAEQAAKARKQRRNKRLMIAGVSTLAVLTLGGLGTAVVIANQPAATVPAYTPQGVGATLPAAPPPQHSATAAWSHPTLADATVNMISPDRLLTADPEGTVTGRHPSTGQPVWRGTKPRKTWPASTRAPGQASPSDAVAERNELRLWPVEMPYRHPERGTDQHRAGTRANSAHRHPHPLHRTWGLVYPCA